MVPRGWGWGGRGRKSASAGGGETPLSHGLSGAERSPPPRGQAAAWAAGAWSRWGWLRTGRLPPQHSAGPPQCSPEAPRSNLHMVSPHARGTDVSSHQEEMPFCFILAVGGGPPEFRAAGGRTAEDQVPGAPHRGPRDVCAAGWATAEGTILPHSLCKVTLEAGTQPPAALGGPKPTPRTGQFGNP